MRLLVAGALALSLLALAAADPWAALGLQRDADESQIKRAYRTLALKLHPDKVHAAAARRRSRLPPPPAAAPTCRASRWAGLT